MAGVQGSAYTLAGAPRPGPGENKRQQRQPWHQEHVAGSKAIGLAVLTGAGTHSWEGHIPDNLPATMELQGNIPVAAWALCQPLPVFGCQISLGAGGKGQGHVLPAPIANPSLGLYLLDLNCSLI